MFPTVVSSVLSLFLIMLVGVYANKKKIITPALNRGLSDLLINVTLPILILTSFMTSFDESMQSNVIKSFLYSLFAFIMLFIISYTLVIPLKGDKKDVVNFSNIFPNTGFIGFPILTVALGSEGVIYGAVYSMFFNFMVFSYGMMLYKGFKKGNDFKKELLNVLKRPAILAVFIGMIVMILSIKVPEIIYSSLKLIGSITGPLSMIVIGVTLSDLKFKNLIMDWTLYYASIIKLIIMPIILIYFFKLIGVTSIVTNTIVILNAMPTATLASIFAEKYNKELEYSTIIVVITTLFSVITIPLIIYLLGQI